VIGFPASRLGLYAAGGHALSGEQIDVMDINQLEKVINQVCVFYRVSPRHKHKIVKVSCFLFRNIGC
jgi:Ca2+-transporting ATPase